MDKNTLLEELEDVYNRQGNALSLVFVDLTQFIHDHGLAEECIVFLKKAAEERGDSHVVDATQSSDVNV